MKNSKIPKTIQKWIDKNKSIIDEYFMEEDDAGDYSIWVYLIPGYYNTAGDCHLIHEWTVKDFLSAARSIEKCDCEDCKLNEAAQ